MRHVSSITLPSLRTTHSPSIEDPTSTGIAWITPILVALLLVRPTTNILNYRNHQRVPMVSTAVPAILYW